MNKYWKHFWTITKHKWYVMIACFKAGLIWQGITHDLSKYSLIEFFTSARYFQGDKSPIDAEKIKNGYSFAWQNHKGKNKHHWQYWTDFEKGNLIILPMPPKYLAEMLCDWVGAGKAYNKGKWTIDSFKNWYAKNKDIYYLHQSTRAYIDMLMKNVIDEKDLFDNWISVKRIKDNYIQDVCEGCAYQPPLKCVPSLSNRQAHEAAAGMGLDDMFFRINGINPDAEYIESKTKD
jgi:hypothetical protein